MRWALIVNGKAFEITDADPAKRFHISLVWVPALPTTEIGDIYNGIGFIKPPALPVSVPQSVSIVQAELALQATPSPTNPGKTLLDDVNAAVDATSDLRVKIAWTKATVVERDGLFVTQIASMIPGLSNPAARDALFIAAAKIVT